MSLVKIKSALEVALESLSPSIDTAWENLDFNPTPGSAFQEVFILFAQPENFEYGSSHRELGYMHVALNYPLSLGSTALLIRAELIRSTFYRGASFTNSGVTVIISNTPEITPSKIEGDRYIAIIKVRFFANIN